MGAAVGLTVGRAVVGFWVGANVGKRVGVDVTGLEVDTTGLKVDTTGLCVAGGIVGASDGAADMVGRLDNVGAAAERGAKSCQSFAHFLSIHPAELALHLPVGT